jgi:protein-S-isoprenylcysteine O-methyltransferase Ste14
MEHPGVIIGLAAMWVLFLVTWTIPAFRRHEPHEAWASLTLSAFISLLFLVYSGTWETGKVDSLVIPAIALQVIALALVAGAFHSLRSMDRPLDIKDQAPAVARSGVYRIMNHPMYVGVALWAVSIGMGRFSPASATLAGVVVALTIIAAITEDAYNVRKFGECYTEYTRSLPLQRLCAKLQRTPGR